MDYQTDDYRLINPVVCIIGAGYVGLVATCCLANSGHQAACVELGKYSTGLYCTSFLTITIQMLSLPFILFYNRK